MKTILIIDDESRTVDMLRLILAKAGYHIVTASDGQEGLEKARSEHPDLILSDVLMPVMDGFTFYKELKKDPSITHIPVIILTARGNMQDSFLALGAEEFLEKPSESSILLAKIERQLARAWVPPKRSVKQVLVAGGSPDIIDKISVQLRAAGCRVEAATIGSEVISKAVNFPPDIVILDVQLEVIPAVEVIRVFRTVSQLRRIPIITYSFYHLLDLADERSREKVEQIDACKERCLEAGAKEYIGRFSEPLFQRTIAKYL